MIKLRYTKVKNDISLMLLPCYCIPKQTWISRMTSFISPVTGKECMRSQIIFLSRILSDEALGSWHASENATVVSVGNAVYIIQAKDLGTFITGKH